MDFVNYQDINNTISRNNQPDTLEEKKKKLEELEEFYPLEELSSFRGICLIVNNVDNDTPYCLRELDNIKQEFRGGYANSDFGNETIERLFKLVENLIKLKHETIQKKKDALDYLSECQDLPSNEIAKFKELDQKINEFNENVKRSKKEINQIKENIENEIKPKLDMLFQKCQEKENSEFGEQNSTVSEKEFSDKLALIQKVTRLIFEKDYQTIESELESLQFKFNELKQTTSEYGNTTLAEVFSLVDKAKKLKLDDVEEKLEVLNSIEGDEEFSDIENLGDLYEDVKDFQEQIQKQNNNMEEFRKQLEEVIYSEISNMSNFFSQLKTNSLNNIQEEFEGDTNNQLSEKFYKELTVVNLFSMIDNFGLFKSGSSKDCKKLEETFTDLNYSVRYLKNLSADEMRNELRNLAVMDHENYDSVVLCFVSHGAQNKIIGCDFRELTIEEIVDQLNSENAKTLREKPKMVFVAACRGGKIDRGNAASPLSDKETKNQCIPLTRDFFFAFATYEGYVTSITKDGTFFIQSLCGNLQEYGRYCKLTSMMTIVNRDVENRMREYHKKTNLNLLFNVVSYSSSLSKEFKF